MSVMGLVFLYISTELILYSAVLAGMIHETEISDGAAEGNALIPVTIRFLDWAKDDAPVTASEMNIANLLIMLNLFMPIFSNKNKILARK